MIGKLNDIEEVALKEFSGNLKSFAKNNIKQILLFGSKARGDFNNGSDIDVFILVE
ncbi:nucleotidyltransferase domain-containing protein [Candidatus Saganbacteria bacterium]|nr:nucleotidyltransferase domain-containing protein [Candidatus Saganbacteria bacterium]